MRKNAEPLPPLMLCLLSLRGVVLRNKGSGSPSPAVRGIASLCNKMQDGLTIRASIG